MREPEFFDRKLWCDRYRNPTCLGGDELIRFADIGYCVSSDGVGRCRYANYSVGCPGGCENDECTSDPCAGKTCVLPPARFCRENAVVVYDNIGRCDQGECIYDEQEVDCDIAGCESGLCGGENACAHVTCLLPPANYCVDDQTLRAHATPGSCKEGSCEYDRLDIFCASGCSEGRCVNDFCAGVQCNLPPVSYCKTLTQLVHWDGNEGLCEDGVCSYQMIEDSCKAGCDLGKCQDSPCQGVVCKTPPATYCRGDAAVTYEQTGHCQGQGTCDYASAETACESGCAAGRCLENPMAPYQAGSPWPWGPVA